MEFLNQKYKNGSNSFNGKDWSNIFQDDASKALLLQCSKGVNRDFYDVNDDIPAKLIITPQVYQFNSQVGTHEIMEPKMLDDIAREIEKHKNYSTEPQSNSSYAYKRKDIDRIKRLLTDLKPQTTEASVFMELALYFCNQKGVMIHSFQPGQTLKVFVEEAALHRKRMGCTFSSSVKSGLSNMEENIMKSLNVEIMELEKMTTEIINRLKPRSNEHDDYSTSEIHTAINSFKLPKSYSKEFPNKAKSKFKKSCIPTEVGKQQIEERKQQNKHGKGTPNINLDVEWKDRYYNKKEVFNELMYSFYQCEAEYQSEWDFLVILPEARAIINIEVKSSRDRDSRNSNVKKAAEQLEKHAVQMAKMIGCVVDFEWSFYKVAAIYPHIANTELRVCDGCSKYLLTENNDIQSVFNELLQTQESMSEGKQKEYKNIMQRLVGFSSLTKRKIPQYSAHAFEQVVGDIDSPIIGGFTPSKEASFFQESHPDFDAIKLMPYTAAKVLYLEKDQVGLLTKHCPRLLVFLSDFGSGKQLFILSKCCVL